MGLLTGSLRTLGALCGAWMGKEVPVSGKRMSRAWDSTCPRELPGHPDALRLKFRSCFIICEKAGKSSEPWE